MNAMHPKKEVYAIAMGGAMSGQKVAYLGPAGSHCQRALAAYRPEAEHIAYPSISAVFAAVSASQVDFGFVPIENVINGRVAQTLDNLRQYAGRLMIAGATILPVLEEEGGERADDKTRFILIGRQSPEPCGRDVTSLVIYPQRDRVKLLHDMLSVISVKHNLNMTDIDRRPDQKGLSIFYIDIEGHLADPNVRACIEDLVESLSDTEVITLGSYPYLPFNEPLIRTIGIIGGTGEMGRFFVPFFTRLGYKVLIAGRRTPLSHTDCARQADAVIVNVPIEHTEDVIRAIGPLMHAGQLLVDNAGVKSRPITTMLANTDPAVEILSIHTMFGASVESLRGQNIISVPTVRSGPMAQEFEDILYKHGAHITRATPDEHDMYVTFTQGLEHMDGVAKLATVFELAGDPANLESFSTPNSRRAAEIYERIHAGDHHLYATMLKENPHILKTLEAYLRNLTEMVADLKNGSTEVFEEKMSRNTTRLKKGS